MIRILTIFFALLGAVGFFYALRMMNRPVPQQVPFVEPARSPYARSIGGTGLVEALGDNVKMAAIVSGVVEKIYVRPADQVKAGDMLFQTEASLERANVATAKAELVSLRAGVEQALQSMNEKKDLSDRMTRLRQKDVNSEEESVQADLALATARAQYARAQADLAHGETQVVEAEVALARTIVRAPRDADILRVNIREGEYAQPFQDDGALVLGNISRLQVRVDIDEDNAVGIRPEAKAVAFTRGPDSLCIPLEYARTEPLLVPKKTLSGERSERVDTRVLQVIYEFEKPATPIRVGQVLDVYIEDSTPAK